MNKYEEYSHAKHNWFKMLEASHSQTKMKHFSSDIKMCLKKMSFGNERAAEDYAKSWAAKNKSDVISRAYHCPVCHKWHLTTH